ncbi:2536_t:CDS:2 [Funneliformis caledonium]|uniref:2536_t:CDS:1 n=1 Tax=Funneliformis caledonium TaxID=1117310 RepID=A0A9N8WJ96_9GLOM|nr:2536_t:CDS:2 [Funneliformis caledonium]
MSQEECNITSAIIGKTLKIKENITRIQHFTAQHDDSKDAFRAFELELKYDISKVNIPREDLAANCLEQTRGTSRRQLPGADMKQGISLVNIPGEVLIAEELWHSCTLVVHQLADQVVIFIDQNRSEKTRRVTKT